jgi:hypothetical protein
VFGGPVRVSLLARAFRAGDIERIRPSDNKASAVHFLHFDFSPAAMAEWKSGAGAAMLVIDHLNHGHAAVIGDALRGYLAKDCF